MKKFIIKTFLFIVPILLVVCSVNYFCDAGRLFTNDYEKKVAEIMSSGHFATNISNYDERILQREIVEIVVPRPDILVLGSSRSLLIKQEFMPENKEVYNSSVSGASIEDLISIYQMYKAKGNLPTKVIIGIDPWMFNENNGQVRWKSIKEYYDGFFEKSSVTNWSSTLNLEKYKQLVSFSYFQSSLKFIPELFQGKTYATVIDNQDNETITKLLDGSLRYGNEYRAISADEVLKSAYEYKSKRPIYSLGNYVELSSDYIDQFKSLIKELENEDVQVAFFLAPYHPIVFDEIEKNYPRVIDAEKFINTFAKQRSILVIGSFNPDITKTDTSFFYDGMHLKEEGIEKLIKENKYVQDWLKR